MNITAKDILEATTCVAKKWTKQRKAEERGNRSRNSRGDMFSKKSLNYMDVADQILPDAYAHASGDGAYTVAKRQMYYASREEFRLLTGKVIDADYFSQNVLVKYMNRHPQKTANWKITASPRGTLAIPNAGYDVRIPCGTIAIEEHLAGTERQLDSFADLRTTLSVQWPSLRAGHRYQAVLYIEKEGFDPQLQEAQIAERYDIAILSCKGQSVTAARRFADNVCRVNGGVPLLIVHDFDKPGFEISQRVTTVSEHQQKNDLVKYYFQNEINVTDLGLRLGDVRKYDLKDEQSKFTGLFPADTIATKEEQEFLGAGRCVELNAFTAPQFIRWIESKLDEHGFSERLIPSDEIIKDAYRRALAVTEINGAIQSATEKAVSNAKLATIPSELRRELTEVMRSSSCAWDVALYGLAKKQALS